jgi:hypothetical protein
VGTDEFETRRFGSLRRALQKAKNFAYKIGVTFEVEDDEYRLSKKENLGYRVQGALALALGVPDGHNKVFEHYKEKNRERVARRDRSDNINLAEASPYEKAKMAAHELLFMAPIRLMGLQAINGAARVAEHIPTDKDNGVKRAAAWVKNNTSARLEMHERGLHNPVLANINGYSRRDVKNLRRSFAKGETTTDNDITTNPFEDDY